jgi:trimethylamine--corrinoid protein Co-methyltransferase
MSEKQIELVDGVSRDLLMDPGLLCYNEEAAAIFKKAGAEVETSNECARVRIPSTVVNEAVESAPSRVVLGARDPDKRLILDASEPRVRFGSGSETNIWLQVDFDGTTPRFTQTPGSIARLRDSAHLCDNLENLDFFIRNVNIRDEGITARNKDVNKYLASLNSISKHVQAGLTHIDALDDVVRLGEIVAGGKEAFAKEPVLSFIACLVKSPLQFVDDTTATVIEIAKRRVPLVVSSCPMAGATGPFDEFGIVAQINAELLAGVTLTQLVSPGTPVLYGSVPVRTRLDNLNDMYGAAEFNHYNLDCAQMARHYGIPCYSTAGVGDTTEPGIQATVEKMLTLMEIPRSGAQYVHYAFGLLDRTNIFCPEQAILDDAHIGLIKRSFAEPEIDETKAKEVADLVREVMATAHRTYVYNLPMPAYEDVYVRYPLEHDEGGALRGAHERYHEILSMPRKPLPDDVIDQLRVEVPGILPESLES